MRPQEEVERQMLTFIHLRKIESPLKSNNNVSRYYHCHSLETHIVLKNVLFCLTCSIFGLVKIQMGLHIHWNTENNFIYIKCA
jgi:hypothetical protein